MKTSDVVKYGPIIVESYSVAGYSEGDVDRGDPLSQVHVVLNVAALDVTFVLRLKSRQAIQELIQALRVQRNEVWPEPSESEKLADLATADADIRREYDTWIAMNFTERDLKLIRNCYQYADDPGGLPGHQLMMLVAALANIAGITVDQNEAE